MDDISRVHIEKATKQLVDKVLNMVLGEVLSRVNDPMQVSFHEFSDNVDIGVACLGFWLEQVDHIDDILMLKEFFIKRWVLSSLIYLTIRLASIRSSKALIT